MHGENGFLKNRQSPPPCLAKIPDARAYRVLSCSSLATRNSLPITGHICSVWQMKEASYSSTINKIVEMRHQLKPQDGSRYPKLFGHFTSEESKALRNKMFGEYAMNCPAEV